MLIIISITGIILLCLFALSLVLGWTNIRFHTKPEENQIRVACIGDSITYGTAIANVFHNCYPAQLGRMLGEEYHISNFGINGKTAIDLNEKSFRRTSQYPLSIRYQPDIAIIMLGTNDAKRKNWVSQDRYKAELRALVQSYLDLDSKPRLILCTVSSAYSVRGRADGTYNYGINEAGLLIVCAAVKELAEEMRLDFIDMYSVTAAHPEWYKFDGTHPDKNGARAIATAVYEKIVEIGKL